MELEHLAAVVALIEAGDSGRAAQRCARTQTQLRADLRAVESWLGVSLAQIDVSGQVHPSAEGRRWLPRAQALLADAAVRSARSEAAIFALIADAKDDDAAAFYRHHGFEPFGGNGLQLIVPLQRFLQAAG